MKQRLEQELKMFLAEIIRQLWFLLTHQWYPPKWVLRRLIGLTPRQIHTVIERAKMTKNNYALWFEILKRDNWTCQNKRCSIRNFENKEWGKPKMQVDHIVPVYHWGKSTRSNLQVLCSVHNKEKGASLTY